MATTVPVDAKKAKQRVREQIPFGLGNKFNNRKNSPTKGLGVAFSGGGIRSAAFCSGVLRRLITKKKEPTYLSCVSGGGYTGSAYVQWKYHRGGDLDKWIQQFFNQMKNNAGYLCNWHNSCANGCMDSIILVALVVFVAIIVPIAGWGSFACPIAFLVNFLYGKFLDGTLCRSNADSVDCRERTILFATSIGVFLVFHFLEYVLDCCENNKNYPKMRVPKVLLKLGQLISGATFAFTFFPWFINDFLQFTHLAIRLAIVVFTSVFWFFVPVLRKYSSLVFLIYVYSYVVYWHVYKGTFFGINYTEERFQNGMIVSLVILGIFSVLGEFPRRLVHIYNRWRLQKAFYYQDQDSSCSKNKEQCCHCYDIFPGGHCPQWCCLSCNCPPSSTEKRALTLADLNGIEPQFISSMVVNGWRREYKKKYCLLTMSPKGIYVIDKQPTSKNENGFENKAILSNMEPSDIKLSSAMAMSAAAVSPHLGKEEELERGFTHILTVCGIEMAANIVSNMNDEREEHWWCGGQFWLYVANIIIMVSISVGGVFLVLAMLAPSFPISSLPVVTTIFVVGGILAAIVLCLLCLLCLCSDNLQCCPSTEPRPGVDVDPNQEWSITRWCVVHLPIYRFVRSMLNIITYSKTPPAMLHLSDGGHFETYGLLPLLELRLPNILVVDGSEINSDDDYAKKIVEAMEHARKLFNCSFTSITDGDVLTDIENTYVKPKKKRIYEFKVQYDGVGADGVSKVKGHIVLISPRKRTKDEKFLWDDDRCEGKDSTKKRSLKDDGWGEGPYLGTQDVESVQRGVGCCECCHCSPKDSDREENTESENLLGDVERGVGCFTFPRHPTLNQFFTPTMFAAYHREGYRACMDCDKFLENITK